VEAKKNNIDIVLTQETLSLDQAFHFVNHVEMGGNCLFIGTVRGLTDQVETMALEFESFEAMAKKELSKIAVQIEAEHGPLNLYIAHRLGMCQPGDVVVIIAVATPHRDKAFAACRQAIDTLKQTVPIWKKEILEDGSFWVNATP
jgi:molybdopterin synthase catalytic subunit